MSKVTVQPGRHRFSAGVSPELPAPAQSVAEVPRAGRAGMLILVYAATLFAYLPALAGGFIHGVVLLRLTATGQ